MKSKILMKYRSLLVRVYSIIFRIIGLFPRNEKLLIFEYYSGKQFSCYPRAIFEYLKENKNKYEYRLIWSIDKRNKGLFDDIQEKDFKKFSLKWLLYLDTAKYWITNITNSCLPQWVPKLRNTTYVQTWHGTPLKKFANDMDEVQMPGTTEQYKRNFLIKASKWDYLISPNAYSTEIFRNAFQLKKIFIESGYPRDDFLYKENRNEEMLKIKERLGINKEKKIFLYAPTWRDNSFYAKGKYKFNMFLDLESLKNQLSNEYIAILRMHYLVPKNINLTVYKGFAHDFSDHNDIRELYLILITDYSSVFFYYAGLKRHFVPDIKFYRNKLRDFMMILKSVLPGLLYKTTEKVIEPIHKTKDLNRMKTLLYFTINFVLWKKVIDLKQLWKNYSDKKLIILKEHLRCCFQL
ncbi:CDP-glycerol glycerophosphotransferase family protein [Bacillus halotolerans]|uniref:CDP-glycerol glycerophosphotransferase family protein n=1 Tax=Bacillus halotolerans TaxID=260554 RepID=UPI00039C1A22|nr:CDP-glycerol glycerophosphotransferase family protein [Bacillus halotolerans]